MLLIVTVEDNDFVLQDDPHVLLLFLVLGWPLSLDACSARSSHRLTRLELSPYFNLI